MFHVAVEVTRLQEGLQVETAYSRSELSILHVFNVSILCMLDLYQKERKCPRDASSLHFFVMGGGHHRREY